MENEMEKLTCDVHGRPACRPMIGHKMDITSMMVLPVMFQDEQDMPVAEAVSEIARYKADWVQVGVSFMTRDGLVGLMPPPPRFPEMPAVGDCARWHLRSVSYIFDAPCSEYPDSDEMTARITQVYWEPHGSMFLRQPANRDWHLDGEIGRCGRPTFKEDERDCVRLQVQFAIMLGAFLKEI